MIFIWKYISKKFVFSLKFHYHRGNRISFEGSCDLRFENFFRFTFSFFRVSRKFSHILDNWVVRMRRQKRFDCHVSCCFASIVVTAAAASFVRFMFNAVFIAWKTFAFSASVSVSAIVTIAFLVVTALIFDIAYCWPTNKCSIRIMSDPMSKYRMRFSLFQLSIGNAVRLELLTIDPNYLKLNEWIEISYLPEDTFKFRLALFDHVFSYALIHPNIA